MMTVITGLILVIAVVSLLQPSAQRLTAAAIFTAIIVLFDVFFGELDGLAYYGGAAISNFMIVLLTSCIIDPTKMILRLQRLCLGMMITNLAGYLLWFFYYPPFFYNLAFIVLFVISLYILLDRERWFYVGGFTANSWSSYFSISNFEMFRNDKSNREAS
tara:strand:- start:10051 stop:10530 length:480 start_codon:yes stop_codon:yes gene_type:complete